LCRCGAVEKKEKGVATGFDGYTRVDPRNLRNPWQKQLSLLLQLDSRKLAKTRENPRQMQLPL
jgi:hypothetical protein